MPDNILFLTTGQHSVSTLGACGAPRPAGWRVMNALKHQPATVLTPLSAVAWPDTAPQRFPNGSSCYLKLQTRPGRRMGRNM
jgi:hypothetical protein